MVLRALRVARSLAAPMTLACGDLARGLGEVLVVFSARGPPSLLGGTFIVVISTFIVLSRISIVVIRTFIVLARISIVVIRTFIVLAQTSIVVT
jgi:hypothetical protein